MEGRKVSSESGLHKSPERRFLFDAFLKALPHREDALRVALKLSEELTKGAKLTDKVDIASVLCTILRESSTFVSENEFQEVGELTSRVSMFVIDCIDSPADPEVTRALAEVSAIYTPVGEAIGTFLVTKIFNAAETLLNEREDIAVKLNQSRNEWMALRHSSYGSHMSPARPGLYACLKFMSVLYQQPSLLPTILPLLLSSLLVLVGASDKMTARTARDTTLALLTHTGGLKNPSEALNNVHEFVWARLSELCAYEVDRTYQESAQSILLRMISITSLKFPSQNLLHSEDYWRLLHDTLRTGTHEGRKFCLAIVASSLGQLQEDFHNSYQSYNLEKASIITADLLKFCTIYHTIILGRYLNQAQACLPDLSQLSNSGSPLHKAWIMSLFFATLGNAMQDSIRRLTGMWILEHGPLVLQQVSSAIPEFLEFYLLPWASEGQHYTSRRETNENGDTICSQGQHLSSFISRLITLASSEEKRFDTIRAVLRFLVKSTPRTYSFPRAYALEGLLNAFKVTNLTLTSDMIASIEKLSSASHFHELANDYMMLLCKDLLTFGEASGSKQAQLLNEACSALAAPVPSLTNGESYIQAVKYFSSWSAAGNEKEDTSGLTVLSQLRLWITTSRTECLKGDGIQAACDIIRYALENTELADGDSSHLTFIIGSVWDEVEIQDYPRRTMMQFPEVLLHPICLRESSTDPTHHDIILDITRQIQTFSENRVYLLPPFARALRRAIMDASQVSGELFRDSLVRYANNPPSTKVEFHLLSELAVKLQKYIPWRTYGSYYGELEGVGHATILDLLNRLPVIYLNEAKRVVDEILDPWMKQKLPPPVFSPWKKTSQLQVILIIMEHLAPTLTVEEAGACFDKFFTIIATEPLPLLRYLFEWIVVRLFQCCQRQHQMLEMLANADITNPKYVVSILKMSLTLACTPTATEAFGYELMLLLVVQCAGAKIAIRHEAQWSVPILWDHALTQKWPTVLTNPAFGRLNDFIRSMDAYKNPPPGRLPEVFNIVDHHHLTHLVEGDYLDIEPIENPRLRREDFLKIPKDSRNAKVQVTASLVQSPPGIMPLGEKRVAKTVINTQPIKGMKSGGATLSVSIPLQIKSQQFTDLVSLGPNSTSSSQKRAVILLASLIDNFHNLGGLSRISEIFGLSSMLVRSTRVLQTKEFQAVSVSSEKHLPIAQLAIDDIPSYLSARKDEGYTVVGVEQTDSSRVLGEGDWTFEEKVIFVMGSEKEGIPAHVLQECNYCIVVKQKGVTRSMNVQTAAAVAIYEYARQRSAA